MKNILGLDLGTSSIGWALIKADDNNKPISIIDMGVRIVPLQENEDNKFTKGQSITTNADRTKQRSQRKCYDRYQMRREALCKELKKYSMMPDESLMKLPILELWQLRAKAVTSQIELPELGRVLYHLNQKRGYLHSKTNASDPKQKEHVKNINNRYLLIKKENYTIGQFFTKKLEETAVVKNEKVFYTYRVKDQVFPRIAYVEEYDAIMRCQRRFYPDVLNDEFINLVKNNIIFYQRDLKSCKHLVSICELEKRTFRDADGNLLRNKQGDVIFDGPKVTPRTSPLFQLCKNWEAVNNIRFHNRKHEELYISLEQRKKMVEHLDNHEILKLKDVHDILGINEDSKWYCGDQLGKGLKGNNTKQKIIKALSHLSDDKIKEITRFNIKTVESKKMCKDLGYVPCVNEETGEVLQIIDPAYEYEPLYRLWHIIYSIKKEVELHNALRRFLKEFNVEDEDAVLNLAKIDFVKDGYGNKSARAISKVLPYLQHGIMYYDACEYVGYNPSNSITAAENSARQLKEVIPAIKKNELRQPTVEKILNQMINIFNQLNNNLRNNNQGQIDSVRIELARELKQSKEERQQTFKQMNILEKQNNSYAEKIRELKLEVTKNRILKYRLWEESEKCCFYCEQPVNLKSFLEGTEFEREHIIPKRLLFDNSFSNQVCSCRKCNQDKAGNTAYDFMKHQPGFDRYLERVEEMFLNKKISRTKQRHLLASYEEYVERKKIGKETKDDIDVWESFIDRQLRLSQYISRKAQDILREGCRNIYSTSGSITDLVRHTWGYDTILHELNFARYKNAKLTEKKKFIHHGHEEEKEVIKDWTKRLDHRHHAIDALAIACTSQSMIQRINTLSAAREEIATEIQLPRAKWDEGYTLLQEWIKVQQPFSREEVKGFVSNIIVSMKAGKRVAVPGKRKVYSGGKSKIVQTGIIVPRNSLHEQTIYGSIKLYAKDKNGNSILGDNIVVRYKMGVGQGCLFSGKENITVDYDKKKNAYLLNDGIGNTLKYIVDKQIRNVITNTINSVCGEDYLSKANEALSVGKKYDGKDLCKLIFERIKNIDENPIYTDKEKRIVIKKVRCFTGLTAVEPLRFKDGKPISFVVTGNNHHVAIYRDENGNYIEAVSTFWHSVERVKYNIPIVIENPQEVWGDILQRKESLPDSFLSKLPEPKWQYITSLQQNDMFILGMSEEEYNEALSDGRQDVINSHIYRVQSLSTNDYWFRLHVETVNDKTPEAKDALKYYRTKSLTSFLSLNPIKIKVSLLGKMIR